MSSAGTEDLWSQSARTSIDEMVNLPAVRRAFERINSLAEETTREQITICEIPAPPFGEAERADYFRRRFLDLGLENVRVDSEGNVLGVRSGIAESPLVVISAHLDTALSPGLEIRVREEGGKLYAPGICDDACALAALLGLIKTLNAESITTQGTLLFLCTVGEEGEGNLRGVRHFFLQEEWRKRVDAFIALEGAGLERIVCCGLGSRRYRLCITGPGGHSWADFGIVNPIHPLARMVIQLMQYPLPEQPPTSLSITRISGGQAINAIPQTAFMDIDVRSTSCEEIRRIETYLRQSVEEAVREEMARKAGSGTHLDHQIELLGDRPAGEVSLDSEIVKVAEEATRAVGAQPQFECASTDANLPISLGIPAIAIGVGGAGGNTHTLEEWYSPEGRELGLQRLLLITLALAGVKQS